MSRTVIHIGETSAYGTCETVVYNMPDGELVLELDGNGWHNLRFDDPAELAAYGQLLIDTANAILTGDAWGIVQDER